MIAIGPPGDEPLSAPGSFAWVYADGWDARGRGFVYVAAHGLPFLPGASRSAGRDRPAVYLVVYEGDAIAFYALREVPGDFRLGATGFEATVDQALPGGGRVRGTVRVSGPAVTGLPDEPGPHRWAPVIASGRAELVLTVDETTITVEGTGYVDQNRSPLGLEALGIDAWTWGRRSGPAGTRIWYRVDGRTPRAFVVDVDRDGVARVHDGKVALGGWRYTRWGLRWPSAVEVDGDPVPRPAVVDSSPAYLRARLPDGTCEWCVVGRLDLPWARPLIAMAVDRADRPSWWLPLFSGRPVDRIPRLWRWWFGGGRPGGPAPPEGTGA